MIFSFTNDRFLLSKCGVLGLSLTSCRVVSQRRCLPDKRHDLSRNPVIVRAQNNEQLVKTYIRADVGISPCAILWNTKPLTFDSDFLKIRWPLHFVLPVCASVFFRKCRRFFIPCHRKRPKTPTLLDSSDTFFRTRAGRPCAMTISNASDSLGLRYRIAIGKATTVEAGQ